MRRRLMNHLTLLSAVAWLVVLALAVRGQFAMDIIRSYPVAKHVQSPYPDRFPLTFFTGWLIDLRNRRDTVSVGCFRTSGSGATPMYSRRTQRPWSSDLEYSAHSFRNALVWTPGLR